MREIKFRGKTKKTGCWVYGFYTKNLYDSNIVAPDNWEHKIIPETVGQFTCLLDKNGKEVFEGDIVKYGNSNFGYGDPRIKEYCLDVLRDITDLYEDSDPGFDPFLIKVGEVIGNIHDNPELLTQS